MNIGQAIEALKQGKRVARAGWNGKGMFLVYVPGSEIVTKEGTPYYNAGLEDVVIDPHIDMYTARGSMQPGWLCSQADLLATDWEIV